MFGCAQNSAVVESAEYGFLQVTEEDLTKVPEIDGEVTAVRVSPVRSPYQTSYKNAFAENFKNREYLQIYYGYQVDGIWYDFPSENYPLAGIFGEEGSFGYDAAGARSHVVRIGSYILICISNEDVGKWGKSGIRDSLQSKVTEPLHEYYTTGPNYVNDEPIYGYGYVKVMKDTIGTDNPEDPKFSTHTNFDRYYFILVPEEQMTDSYTLKTGKLQNTITGKRILELLEEAETAG